MALAGLVFPVGCESVSHRDTEKPPNLNGAADDLNGAAERTRMSSPTAESDAIGANAPNAFDVARRTNEPNVRS